MRRRSRRIDLRSPGSSYMPVPPRRLVASTLLPPTPEIITSMDKRGVQSSYTTASVQETSLRDAHAHCITFAV